MTLGLTLLAIILVLLFEQQQAFPMQHWVRDPVQRLALRVGEKLNDGSRALGTLAWTLVVVLPTFLVLLVHGVLMWFGESVAAFAWALLALYATLGFRQFSHYFTDIQLALQANDKDEARRLLALWRGANCDRLRSGEIARLAIETGLVSSHRYVFAPLFWFVVLGPAGAVLYRLAETLHAAWQYKEGETYGQFNIVARQAFVVLDWLPVRVTAAAFAVAGDFEDAVQCWRTQARQWPDLATGILLAAGAGAMGVRVGIPTRGGESELGLGDDADADFMQSTVGLVWRSLVFLLALLVLVWVSSWAG
jgi:adenosylcobinamide-phosphate synthase